MPISNLVLRSKAIEQVGRSDFKLCLWSHVDDVQDVDPIVWYYSSRPTDLSSSESFVNKLKDFRNQRWPRKDFRGFDWSDHDFTNSVLFGAKFQECLIERSVFVNVDLQGANFSGAVCMGSDFSGADLADAKMDNADLRNCIFDLAIFSVTSIDHADFSGSTFIRTDLRFQDLTRADLIGCDFSDAIFL